MINKQVWRLAAVPVLALLLPAGCRTEAINAPPAPLDQQEQQTGLRVGRDYGNAILAAMRAGDYPAFTAHFSPELKKSVDEQAFQALKKQIGAIVADQFLTELVRPVFCTLVWKVSVERPAADGTRTYRGDLLFTLTLSKGADGWQIVGCRFF